MFRFLNLPTDERLIAGVGLKILGALEVFSDEHIDVGKLPGALEDLSTGFESYLRKRLL